MFLKLRSNALDMGQARPMQTAELSALVTTASALLTGANMAVSALTYHRVRPRVTIRAGCTHAEDRTRLGLKARIRNQSPTATTIESVYIKSAFAARYPASWRICFDLLRQDATDLEADQTATPVAAGIQSPLLDAQIACSLRAILDFTNATAQVRAELSARARGWQRPTAAILFDVPLATAKARNAFRDRGVSVHVVRELHALTPTREQPLAEGFGTVHLASELATAGAGW